MTQTSEWVGPVGDVWAQEWRRTDRSFAELSTRLDAAIHAAAPAGDFRALDVGCGAGGTSLTLHAARPDAAIVGIDVSIALVEVARSRGAEIRTDALPVRFIVGDAVQLAASHGPFDLVYSRHGVMFFADPVAAFAALHHAAAPGARLIFSCFRDWRLNGFYADLALQLGAAPPEPGVPGPFAFADREYVASILADAGWRDAAVRAVDFTYRAGAGDEPVGDAVAFLSRIGPAARQLRDTPAADRPELLERLRTVMAVHLHDGTVDFPAAAWIWSATA